jgi:hypothetical protein
VNDDVEDILERLAPEGPAFDLRTRVLGAVVGELHRRGDSRRPWFAALAAAAALVVSVGLNVWADRSLGASLARIVGPIPLEREALDLANDVAVVTDAETGRWFYERVTSGRGTQQACRQFLADYQRVLNELLLVGKDRNHEESPPSDRDRRGGDRRDTSWDQRLFRLEERCPA